ncbi:MAG: HAMP domain-containing histidine kinase, partial [Bacteriovoracaceae bacterium]|nr:HAMP domain-containing histidine kinase [Bacteriovoracaceae bacterium]
RLLNIKISDQGNVLYNEHNSSDRTPLLSKIMNLNVYGRTWEFEIRTTKKFEQAATSNLPITILFSGAMIEALLVILFINMANSKSKAVELAKKMSHEANLQRRSAEQASKLAALGEMAGGIAHEINNPLNLIMTHSYFLSEIDKQGLSKDVANEITESTTKIESSVQRIATIVDGLRHFSRDGSQDSLKKESVDSILKETIEFAKEGFKTKNVSIIYECFGDSYINCNRVQISQVLINLLNNAQFVASKSQEKQIHIGVNTDIQKRILVIKVSNSGEQIPKELRDKIFQPFFTTKEAGQGTGIGLSISKNIVEAHDGKLYLDPHSSQTTFVIELPTVSS